MKPLTSKQTYVPILAILPSKLEYENGVLKDDSMRVLEQTINWYMNYAQVYLESLRFARYEDLSAVEKETDFSRFHFKNLE